MDDILKDLGWGDGFRIPVANDENRALEAEIQKKLKEKENLKSVLEKVNEKLNLMKKHAENIEHQTKQNQNLIFAHNNQKAAEENLVKLTRTEDNFLTNEIKKIKKEEEEVQHRLTGVQMDIDKTLQHIDKLNITIKWDKDALLAWDEELSRGDDDTLMLEKFRKEDEAKFKELELKRQYLGTDLENKRNRLISLKNDITSMEQSLEKTAQMFRRQHIDRRALVQQWEGSVRILHQQDEDINGAMEEIGNLKSLANERLKVYEEQKTFFENEVKNNKEIERDIKVFNKQISDARENIRIQENAVTEEKDQLTCLKTILETTTTVFHKEVIRLKKLHKEFEAKNVQIVEMKMKKDKAVEDMEKWKSKITTSAERVERLQNLLLEEEKMENKNFLESKKLDELTFQAVLQLKELKETEKNQMGTIRHAQSQSASLKKNIEKAKMELAKQQEILYNMDFAYMEKNIFLNKILGVTKEEDAEKHEKRISELEEIQRKLTATNALLTKEVNRLEDEMRRVTMDIQGDIREEEYLRNKRQNNHLLVENGQKQLKILRDQNQDKQVDENVLKLRVRQAERAIDKVGNKVFGLEKQRLELEEAMKEREIEIKSLGDVLNVRRRILNEQASNLNSRINLAKLKVANLKSKYEVEVLKLGKDENGEPLSMTHLKVKGAQEKFELQELGDKLDSKIKKTETEIEAMENTLKVVNATNKAFKNNLQTINPNSPEQLEKNKLEQTQADMLAEYRKKKAILDSMEVITLDLEEEYQEKLRMEEAIIREWREKDQQAAETDKELKEQEEKLERAGKQLKRLVKEIRGTKMLKFQTIEEKDIELRELMDQNEYGLQQLAELVAKTYDTGPVVVQYLSEKGLSLPMIKSPAGSLKCPSTTSLPSARSSAKWSARSSTSSRSSDSNASRSSSCVFAPSVVTLDSSRLSGTSGCSGVAWKVEVSRHLALQEGVEIAREKNFNLVKEFCDFPSTNFLRSFGGRNSAQPAALRTNPLTRTQGCIECRLK